MSQLISKRAPNSCSNTISVLTDLANKLDKIGAYAVADIVDETSLIVKKAQQTPQQLAQQQQQAQQAQLADRFVNIHAEMLNAMRTFSNPSTIPSGMKRVLDQIRELGLAANAFKQSLSTTTQVTPTILPTSTGSAIRELVSLADKMDVEGQYVLADALGYVAHIINKFSIEEEKENKSPIKPGNLSALSTRYCPDHIGVQAIRVADRTYQCPIDGRTYDYESGYVDYNGQKVPGGSIANQTPSSTPYQLPQRLYDSRQNVLNTIN